MIPPMAVWQTGSHHGTVFYDNTSRSPFPTRLHLRLLALEIDVSFTRKRCPTDHAIERTHQTMTLQALLGQAWPSQTALRIQHTAYGIVLACQVIENLDFIPT